MKLSIWVIVALIIILFSSYLFELLPFIHIILAIFGILTLFCIVYMIIIDIKNTLDR